MNKRLLGFVAVSIGCCAMVSAQEWKSIGSGVYYEDLMTALDPTIEPGQHWAVDIEESTAVSGLYRFIPYHQYSPIAEYLGGADATYMVVHAENPDKVWIEDFEPYPEYEIYSFSQMCAESGWDTSTAYKYGTLADGVISFPDRSIATVDIMSGDQQWINAATNGLFKIILPGSGEVKDDYSLYLSYGWCGSDNHVPVLYKAGGDVASVKYLLKKGLVEVTDEYVSQVASDGLTAAGGEIVAAPASRGVHTLVVATLDASGAPRDKKTAYVYGSDDEEGQWESLGMTWYNESFVAGYYEDIPELELNVEIQKHKSIAGFFRLVNPYASHPWNTAVTHAGHAHYIYIHAEDPAHVYIENSPIGTDFGFGEGRVTSTVANLLDSGWTLDEIKDAGAEFGTLVDGTIEFRNWGLWYGERDYFDGGWTSTGEHFRVKIPAGGLSGIISPSDDGAAAGIPAEYYNLQGVRLPSRPASGIYVEKRGDKVSKVSAR
ncbi:hypothetical protein [uncultured Muribaculum sp.]|uniref:hypothetical protein n=1 Tax=uncultured Muribaculum sp. TaxID=1918613 RepID=UPI0025D5A0BB|nr:hypothetical protein [uncultured Muribaculum sp.]